MGGPKPERVACEQPVHMEKGVSCGSLSIGLLLKKSKFYWMPLSERVFVFTKSKHKT